MWLSGSIRRGFDPWWGRSHGEGNGNPLQYSCLENPVDREAWRGVGEGAIAHRVRKEWNMT